MGSTIPGQVVLDCVRNLAAHEPESQAESKPAHTCSSMASDSSSLSHGFAS